MLDIINGPRAVPNYEFNMDGVSEYGVKERTQLGMIKG